MTFEEWWSSDKASELAGDLCLDMMTGGELEAVKEFARKTWEVSKLHQQKTLRAEQPTLRDQFAMAAFTGLLANSDLIGEAEDYARWAYQHADAMLKEREK